MEHILLILTVTIVETRYIKVHNYIDIHNHIDTSSMAQFLLFLSCGIFVDILFVRLCQLLFACDSPHPYHQLHLCDCFNCCSLLRFSLKQWGICPEHARIPYQCSMFTYFHVSLSYVI
jgi:hypothetical protein